MFECRYCWQTKVADERSCAKGVAQCKSCYNARARERYHQYYGESHRERVKAHKRLNREIAQHWVVGFLREHPCGDCGEIDLLVLDFDHLFDKKANVSWLVGNGATLKRVQIEVAKCEVVCANCHRRRTAKRNGTALWKQN